MTNTGPIVFATYAEDDTDAAAALTMAESLRGFGGSLSDAPLWLYCPEEKPELAAAVAGRAAELGVAVKASPTPEPAREYYFAMKVYAAAAAESAAAAGRHPLLAWLDPDTVVVREPAAFLLKPGTALACRPVMHRLIGSSYDGPADEFWARAYRAMGVAADRIFPVTAPVDGAVIRAYFNAGMLVARPERGTLRQWPAQFERLYTDGFFREQCRQDQRRRVFLHQVALAGAVLTALTRAEIALLDESYNYPFFFFDQYPADRRPASLDDPVTLRHDLRMFQDTEFYRRAGDGSAIIAWLERRLPAAR
ncbi:MAG: hypothetical protein MUF78_07980 [Candidatus Edwardsbacteria bacterium]|jgi:hypothetical protein|nr:hypothetical protein [Candidatus Edwardsbacteria bacterium]